MVALGLWGWESSWQSPHNLGFPLVMFPQEVLERGDKGVSSRTWRVPILLGMCPPLQQRKVSERGPMSLLGCSHVPLVMKKRDAKTGGKGNWGHYS